MAGLNASGKTLLAEKTRREMRSDSVRYVAFCDTYGTRTDRSYYLQQRWNQHDIDEETPHVGEALERSFLLSGADNGERRDMQRRLYALMGMEQLLGKYVISLSSGELRKMQLVKTLMARPTTLILDNPFIGLDAEARSMLAEQLIALREEGMTLYLIMARPNAIMPMADETIWTSDEKEFMSPPRTAQTVANEGAATPLEGAHSSSPVSCQDKEVIRLNDVTVRYGGRTILDGINWTVRQGEHWALSGRNGSGKSTLLSLICADNPQGYACDITLFGHRRGSGESIWEIKRRIGYVSPELHRSYQRNLPVIDIVASGLKDTVGLYARTNPAERGQCLEWMRRFGIDALADRSFMQISSGEQRMALVCRAFVKSPELIILDEPMHGLDLRRQQLVKEIIDNYSANPLRTLVMVTHYQEELPTCIDHWKEL